jgi:hypothetical protein
MSTKAGQVSGRTKLAMFQRKVRSGTNDGIVRHIPRGAGAGRSENEFVGGLPR